MAEKDKNPEIRFTGLTDVWEQRKLGEIYTERKERGYDSLQILSVSIHHGVSNEELDSDTLGKKVRRSEDKSLYKHVYFGDLVLNMMRAWQGAIGVVKSEGMVSPAYITAIPSIQLYPLFMDYCLRRYETIIQMNNLSYGVTDFRKRLYWDSFINVLCHIPSVSEQERVTAFCTHLDNLISLHQRKYDKLVILKKSMLEKMFPKDGADVPEIRFAGFTDAWEQRKFRDMYEKVSEKNDLSYGTDKIISVANMYFKADVYISDKEYLRTYNIFKLGDIAFEGNKSKDFAHGRFVENSIGDGIVSHVFDVFRPIMEFDLLFWKYAINNERLMRNVLIRCTKSSTMMTNLVANDFLEERFQVPCIEEQKKVGMFFDHLDHLIILHRRELEKLKNIKKSILEKMFV